MIFIILLIGMASRLSRKQHPIREKFDDEANQRLHQIPSLSTCARRRCRLHRLSAASRRWRLADAFNMDDPARRLPLSRSDERSKAVPERPAKARTGARWFLTP